VIEQVRAQVTRMLRLDESAAVIAAFHARDPRWRESGRGRLFRSPTVFEDVIKTVTSCNVQWPGTITMNRRLCEVVGPRVDGEVGAGKRGAAIRAAADTRGFPDAAGLGRARAGTLRSRCRVGYRDARIVALSRLFAMGAGGGGGRGGVDVARLEDAATPDAEVWETLLDLPGIGPYAAANVMQLLGRYARLPLDTESVRHGRVVLGYTGTPKQIMTRLHAHYAPFGPDAFRSYWLELWSFYESKFGPAWTWERDTTGRVFTAAMLGKA
jgi:3-methyladenine DNA glycosylase/8-oxoguanine DNA glycosylase